jgi:hypothetical protein
MNQLQKIDDVERLLGMMLRWVEGRAFWIMVGVMLSQHIR